METELPFALTLFWGGCWGLRAMTIERSIAEPCPCGEHSTDTELARPVLAALWVPRQCSGPLPCKPFLPALRRDCCWSPFQHATGRDPSSCLVVSVTMTVSTWLAWCRGELHLPRPGWNSSSWLWRPVPGEPWRYLYPWEQEVLLPADGTRLYHPTRLPL